jgi:hypothetical protein
MRPCGNLEDAVDDATATPATGGRGSCSGDVATTATAAYDEDAGKPSLSDNKVSG